MKQRRKRLWRRREHENRRGYEGRSDSIRLDLNDVVRHDVRQSMNPVTSADARARIRVNREAENLERAGNGDVGATGWRRVCGTAVAAGRRKGGARVLRIMGGFYSSSARAAG